jgi:bacillithiol system protein YtxJ
MINWLVLNSEHQLADIVKASHERAQVIFKHSTRCSISGVAKNRLDKQEQPATIDFHYLDLIAFRPISQAIAEQFQVHHESPQVLLIKNGACVYDESHMSISMDEILEQAAL